MKPVISHPAENGKPEKLLTCHLVEVATSATKKIGNNNFNLSVINKEDLQDFIFTVAMLHDFGKATPYFQKYIRLTDEERKSFPFKDHKNHALLSGIVTFYVFKNKNYSDLFAYLAFHIVYRHHGNLVDFDLSNNSNIKNNKAILNDQLNKICKASYFNELVNYYNKHGIDLTTIKQLSFDNFIKFLKNTDEIIDNHLKNFDARIEFFLIVNYLFSVLIESDKLDAAKLNNDVYFKNNLSEDIFDINTYLNNLKKSNPNKFNTENDINKIRNKFIEEINSFNFSSESHFHTLTAPTGIGKTFGCLLFAEKLKKEFSEARIIYCLPYTSIIDQNYCEFKEAVKFKLGKKYDKKPQRYLAKHHHLEPKIIKNRQQEEYKYKDYLNDLLLTETWQSAAIVTTFVQLFHSIFTNNNRALLKFHNIVNSIIILDEVQSIDPDYYLLIREVFKILAERFNTYFLLMTATQPKIFPENKISNVVNPENFMINEIFDRVKLHIDLAEKTLDDFIQYFTDTFTENNCLIVFNTKKLAVECYKIIKEKFKDYHVYCLTNYLIPKDKSKKIEEINSLLNKEEKVIVISTQLIEAGVDLDFKNVYRDIAPIDSIIQVAGRCNRNGKYGRQGGSMLVVNLNNHRIYNNKCIEIVKELLSEYKTISSKDFYFLSNQYYERLNFTRLSHQILNAIYNINYTTERKDEIPISDFDLIDEKNQTSIYIFPTENDQKIMDEFIILRNELKTNKELSPEEKDNILLRIAKTKIELKQFQLNVYQNDLKSYDGLLQPYEEIVEDSDFHYKFIHNKNLNYDKNIGFMEKSLQEEINDQFF